MRIWKPKLAGTWLVIAVMCCMVNSLSADTCGLFTYEVRGESITITRYPEFAVGAVDIPSTINSKPVTSLDVQAFAYCSGLTSITVPVGVSSIGDFAFFSCTGLTSITIPASVTSLGKLAFSDCRRLSSVTIPSGVADIGDSVFCVCPKLIAINVDPHNAKFSSMDGVLFDKTQSSLIQWPDGKSGSLSLPASVTSIANEAFSQCTGLAAINVDSLNADFSSVDGVLFNKTQTTLIQWPGGKAGTVTIPATVTSIRDFAFSLCAGLKSINVDSHNAKYSSVDGVLFNKDQTTLIQCPYDKTGSVSIPASVISIEKDAFTRCTGLEAIKVDTLNAVYCSSDGVLFDKNGTTLIRYAGSKNGNVTIPANVTRIGKNAFSHCVNLASVTIPSCVTSIGDSAFDSCHNLFSVSIADGVTSIGVGSFNKCTSLTSIRIPASITSIGGYAFDSCTHLTGVYFSGNAPSIELVPFDDNAAGFTVYYLNGKTGFTSPKWKGYKAVKKYESK